MKTLGEKYLNSYSGVNSILDGINDLIHPRGLRVVVTDEPELPGEEPADVDEK